MAHDDNGTDSGSNWDQVDDGNFYIALTASGGGFIAGSTGGAIESVEGNTLREIGSIGGGAIIDSLATDGTTVVGTTLDSGSVFEVPLAGGKVKSLALDANGALGPVSLADGLAWLIDGDRVGVVPVGPAGFGTVTWARTANSPRALAANADGTAWISTSAGVGLATFRSTPSPSVSFSGGIAVGGGARAIVVGHDGEVYFGTKTGLARVAAGQVQQLGGDVPAWSLFAVGDEIAYAGTPIDHTGVDEPGIEAGYYRIDHGTFHDMPGPIGVTVVSGGPPPPAVAVAGGKICYLNIALYCAANTAVPTISVTFRYPIPSGVPKMLADITVSDPDGGPVPTGTVNLMDSEVGLSAGSGGINDVIASVRTQGSAKLVNGHATIAIPNIIQLEQLDGGVDLYWSAQRMVTYLGDKAHAYTHSTPIDIVRAGYPQSSAWLATIYWRYLNSSSIDPSGWDYWNGRLASGVSRATVANNIFASDRYRTAEIAQLYGDILRRQPDARGLDHYLARLRAGGSIASVRAELLGSDEYRFLWSQGDPVGQYYQYLLGREIDPAGRAAWTRAVQEGESYASIADAIQRSHEGRLHRMLDLSVAYARGSTDPSQPLLISLAQRLYRGLSEEQALAIYVGDPTFASAINN